MSDLYDGESHDIDVERKLDEETKLLLVDAGVNENNRQAEQLTRKRRRGR